MTKFTEGPYSVDEFAAIVNAPDGTPVCKMLWPTTIRSEQETKANAELFAKAPEMYESLKNFVECWSDETGFSNPYHSDAEKARALLAEIDQ